VYIGYLRIVEGDAPWLIHTVRGIGYVLRGVMSIRLRLTLITAPFWPTLCLGLALYNIQEQNSMNALPDRSAAASRSVLSLENRCCRQCRTSCNLLRRPVPSALLAIRPSRGSRTGDIPASDTGATCCQPTAVRDALPLSVAGPRRCADRETAGCRREAAHLLPRSCRMGRSVHRAGGPFTGRARAHAGGRPERCCLPGR
jgi:hypothetical protein